MNMNREILRIALPNIVSNITVPLMGIVSTAIAGHWGDDSAAAIGALAIGVSIFNFIYWNCSFVRMGTSGLTAQAFGAGRFGECANMLARALAAAGAAGMQNAVFPMCTAITVNVVHTLCSLWFAFGMDLGIVGIAYASVVAQWTGVALASVLLVAKYRPVLRLIDWSQVLDLRPLKTYFSINRDIILRTFCIVAVYTFFTGSSARLGNQELLAVNALLLELFTLFSYMNDGFAYAAEALTGRFIGARDGGALRRCLKGCLAWGTLISALFVVIYIIWWRDLVGLFVSSTAANAEALVATAGEYIVWIIIIPIASAMPFIMDGIMVGATETRVMRNSMFFATAAYFGIYYALHPLIGNNALWLAFTLYMFLRGVLQYFMTRRLSAILAKATDRA